MLIARASKTMAECRDSKLTNIKSRLVHNNKMEYLSYTYFLKLYKILFLLVPV